jgi:hypothetical protein
MPFDATSILGELIVGEWYIAIPDDFINDYVALPPPRPSGRSVIATRHDVMEDNSAWYELYWLAPACALPTLDPEA